MVAVDLSDNDHQDPRLAVTLRALSHLMPPARMRISRTSKMTTNTPPKVTSLAPFES